MKENLSLRIAGIKRHLDFVDEIIKIWQEGNLIWARYKFKGQEQMSSFKVRVNSKTRNAS